MTSSTQTTSTPKVAVNDTGSEEEFLAAIDQTIKYFNDGDIVEGTVVKVDRDEVLLDIGYKTEGVIPSRELSIKHDVAVVEVFDGLVDRGEECLLGPDVVDRYLRGRGGLRAARHVWVGSGYGQDMNVGAPELMQ